MKLFKKAVIFLISISLIGCTEVIDVDLETASPKLVIDASIDWVKDTPGNEQKIKLSSRTGYYDAEFPAVSGATIFIANSTGKIFDFSESVHTGEYVCANFVPVIGETYYLTVKLNGETYTAVETMTAVPLIEDSVTQSKSGGFTGDEMEIKFLYQDDGSTRNYYLTRIRTKYVAFPQYSLESDEMYQGNKIQGFYSYKDLAAGDSVEIRLYGVSKGFYEYFNKLLVASGNDDSPFATIPATVRGNIINQADEGNYPLGYFRLSEIAAKDYVIQ